MKWHGTIIKNSLYDVRVLDEVAITKSWVKENGISSKWLVLEVETDNINKVTELLKKGLRPGWYAVFRNNDRIIVVFKGKSFNIKRGSEKSISMIRNWAFKKYNLLPELFKLNVNEL